MDSIIARTMDVFGPLNFSDSCQQRSTMISFCFLMYLVLVLNWTFHEVAKSDLGISKVSR